MNLATLFKKLVPYSDDAAKVVDDIPVPPDRTFEFTNPFGQLVSADYDNPGIWNIGGKTFHDLPEGSLLTDQAILKEELLNKRTGRGYLNELPAPIDHSFDSPPAPIVTDAYGSRSIDGWTHYDQLPDVFGQRTDLIDSVDFPDGFTNPDDFARYYDSVELGYLPAEFEDGMWSTIRSNDANSMALAYNLLKQQELNMPMTPRTFEQSKMLVNKYLEPGYYATKNKSIPNQQFVRQRSLDGTLYDLYDRILNATKH